MRVTFNTFPNGLVDQLTQLTTRQNGYQLQASTGQRITNAEDDPAAVRRVLDLQGESKTLAQYQRNISRQQEVAAASFNAMKQTKSLVDRAGEIATLADGTKSQDTLNALGIEVDALLAQAIQFANTKDRGNSLFGGTVPDQPAFTATRNASGSITGVIYNGNTQLPESEVSEKSVLSSQTLGANTTGTGARGLFVDSASGADLFQHLVSLRDHLKAGNTAAINTTDTASLRKDEESFLYHIGTNGGIQSRLEATTAILKQRGDSLTKLVSNEADADLATTLVKLNQTQTAYQAALQSGGKILNQSLLNYLQ